MVNLSDNPQTLDINQIINILPHRYPFLLVDRVLEMDIEKGYILAQKNVTINESFFQGHFPGAPIMPGVLILEALAQAGGILVHLRGPGDKIAILLNVNNAKFRQPVKPGDVLHLRGQGLHFSSKGGRIKAEALVNDKVVAEAEIGFVFVDKSQI
ncbi:(3R)-hydroxymyristoyl-[acyl-carrier-protein] dehydratase FabZ [Candidatus Protochlamydia naegleriophila]|uniref:3-hydroxyacyl-[acyl-carrier-protein] dehydratase FabZ n=1 Tax=Candidatus Protochlamydia naegleriophila TaxID=389348 RepID=A0A0U5JIF7_9BACT|nr:3-hydroxyacyl-ACP dehydratase FabZ [Candidatus Protochlamydia naegleriophila]CUI17574.1 (3R)-hydroxymyristoyl-[acyl-carrier-protein] dehydratase FabZ [Candidatus Protochlamydia naegleriophila]